MNSWWETPLNSRFLEEIGEVINEGNIALIFKPQHIPSSFLSELKKSLSKDIGVSFEKINLSECDSQEIKPVESYLFQCFELQTRSEDFIPKTAADIFKNIELDQDQVFVFEKLPVGLLGEFKSFINDLGRYLSRETIFERHKVIVVLDPKIFKENDFANESGIFKIFFKSFFDKLDVKLALRYFYKYRGNNFSLLNESIIASISLFDTKLIDELVGCDNLIKDFSEVLESYAIERNWKDIEYKNLDNLSESEEWERWAKGILEVKNDKTIYHSAYLKIHNQDLKLAKQIWVSSIEVLIPLIEEFRVRLLTSANLVFLDSSLKTKDGEIIENKLDLEIGEICHFINRNIIKIRWLSVSEKNDLKEYINLCREIRNELSHISMPEASKINLFIEDYKKSTKLLGSE